MSVNKVILIGNVGQDPEVRRFENGDSVANFSLATSEKYKNRNGEKVEDTEWHNIVMRGKVVEVVEKHVTKGMKLYVEGKKKTRMYEKDGEKRYVVEIVCWDMTFVDSKVQQSSNPVHDSQQEPEWLQSN